MSEEDALKDLILDALADSTKTIRVSPNKGKQQVNGVSYFISFIISLDPATHDRLRDLADQQKCPPVKLMRQICMDGFRQCFSADEVDEAA